MRNAVSLLKRNTRLGAHRGTCLDDNLPEQGETAVRGDEEEEDDYKGRPENKQQHKKVTSSLGDRCLSDRLSYPVSSDNQVQSYHI